MVLNLMKKYATHSQLDQVEVLNLLPSDWLLASVGKKNIIILLLLILDKVYIL